MFWSSRYIAHFYARGVGSTLLEITLFCIFRMSCTMWHTASFGSGMKTASADPPSGTSLCLGGLRAGACKRCGGWFGPNFSAPRGARAIVEGWTPSGHTRLLPASRLTVAPGRCMDSQQSGQQSATLLRIRALPVPWSTGCAFGCHLLRAVRIGRMGICVLVHSTLWRQSLIGMQPDVASGRCACSCACVLRASPVSIAR